MNIMWMRVKSPGLVRQINSFLVKNKSMKTSSKFNNEILIKEITGRRSYEEVMVKKPKEIKKKLKKIKSGGKLLLFY